MHVEGHRKKILLLLSFCPLILPIGKIFPIYLISVSFGRKLIVFESVFALRHERKKTLYNAIAHCLNNRKRIIEFYADFYRVNKNYS